MINNKKYVGITSRTNPNHRWQNGNGYHENSHFRAAIKKYGWDSFRHEVIHNNLTKEEANKKEKYYIALWKMQDREFGYNMTSGGDGTPGYIPSEETRAKLSEARKKENLSEETLKRRSEGLRGRKFSEDHKRKIGEGNSKPIQMFSKDGVLIETFASAHEAEIKLGINHSHISQCCNNKRKSTGGYIWKFVQIA